MEVIRNKPFYKGVSPDLNSPIQTSKCQFQPETDVTASGIDTDPDEDCGEGINFCRSIAEALKWGPKVVEIFVPAGVTVIDTGQKLRAEKVRVGSVVNLHRADLSGAHLYGVNLNGADLRGVNLSGAYLRGAHLSGAHLRWANLSRADLYGANLSGANLNGADLSGANLSRADLREADLYGANLSGADLYGADLREAKFQNGSVIQ